MTETTESELGSATRTNQKPLTEVLGVASDATHLYVADDSVAVTVVQKSDGATSMVRHPGYASSVPRFVGNTRSYAVAQDDAWVYVASRNSFIPAGFRLWKMNKVTHAAEVLYEAHVHPHSGGPIVVADNQVYFGLAPYESGMPRGIYAVPTSGGAVRFVAEAGGDSAVAYGEYLYILTGFVLDRVHRTTGVEDRVFAGPSHDHDFKNLAVGPGGLYFVDGRNCKVYAHAPGTSATSVVNAAFASANPWWTCRLAADAAGVYWAAVQGGQVKVLRSDGAGGGTLLLDEPRTAFPSAGPRFRGISLDVSHVYTAFDGGGLYATPR